MEPSLTRLPGSPGCVICDNNGSNPRSLRLAIMWDEADKSVCIPCEPDETWCGYSNIVHGGLIASVLDEAMAWAVKQVSGDWGFTADYNIRFKAALTPGAKYTATARVLENGRRTIRVEGRFTDAQGKTAALATATFLPAKGRAQPRD